MYNEMLSFPALMANFCQEAYRNNEYRIDEGSSIPFYIYKNDDDEPRLYEKLPVANDDGLRQFILSNLGLDRNSLIRMGCAEDAKRDKRRRRDNDHSYFSPPPLYYKI